MTLTINKNQSLRLKLMMIGNLGNSYSNTLGLIISRYNESAKEGEEESGTFEFSQEEAQQLYNMRTGAMLIRNETVMTFLDELAAGMQPSMKTMTCVATSLALFSKTNHVLGDAIASLSWDHPDAKEHEGQLLCPHCGLLFMKDETKK